ncbi:hypothetical protein E4O92_01125 [Massilia horti]|uniref:Integrase n=1 Tax=Massilia horti TaxID=2562153 RepID=A0A4Y9T953_9BURK|nr:hypothetical protein E4O92_01125 [Massilia horti]
MGEQSLQTRLLTCENFNIARALAIAQNPDMVVAIREFQFRDLRAKAGTDKEEQQGMHAAKDQLGHASETMTRRYIRYRKGNYVEAGQVDFAGKRPFFAEKPSK